MLQQETVHPVERVQRLYDDHCFLKAFRESAEYWKSSTNLNQLSVQELILGGRLAARLGGWRLSRWLFRAALERNPSDPRVRYFSNHLRLRRWRLLDELRDFQANPIISEDDAEIQAAWLASHAITWAMLRDFTTAHSCLERAHALGTRDGWVLSCESDVFGLQDRWHDALRSAERAWEINPGSPFAARSVGNSLLNLRRIEDSARRLAAAAEHSESYEITHLGCWHNCALAETLEADDRRVALQTCLRLANRLEVLAPLADRECRSLFARIWLDIAELSDDHAEMERWAKEVRA